MIKTFYKNLRSHIHFIYLLYALPMVCMTAIITPPFQNPDEPNHFYRAEQVSRLELVPDFVYDTVGVSGQSDTATFDPRIQYPDRGGFAVDQGIPAAYAIFLKIGQNSKEKVTRQEFDDAGKIGWGGGMRFINFGNTAIYPPVVYLMPATGIALGKLFGLSVVKTLYLSRLLNGLLSIAFCFCALLLAKRSNVLMFIVLLFPMTIAVFASVSQDAVLISCSFLLVGIIDRVEFDTSGRYSTRALYAMILLMTVIGIAKPPYVFFVLIFLFLKLSRKLKMISIAVPVLVLIFWLLIDHASFSVKFAPADLRVNTGLQVLYIIQHPFRFTGMFFDFDKPGLINFAHMFVGVLGWLDLELPGIYYRNVYILLTIGIIYSLRPGSSRHITLRAGLLMCAFGTMVLVLTAQYVTWTPLEASSLGAMQGRYALPVVPFVAMALSSSWDGEKLVPVKLFILTVLLSFPVYTAVILIKGLNLRYY